MILHMFMLILIYVKKMSFELIFPSFMSEHLQARPDLKMEFFHLMSFLLSYCTSKWKAATDQVIFCMSLFSNACKTGRSFKYDLYQFQNCRPYPQSMYLMNDHTVNVNISILGIFL